MGKLQIKVKKAELDLTLLKNYQAYNVYPKFLAFNIPHSNRPYKEVYENVFSKVRSTEEEKSILN